MRKILTTVSKVLLNVFLYLFIIITVGSVIALQNESMINKTLKIKTYELQKIENGNDIDPEEIEYFKPSKDCDTVYKSKENAEKWSQEVVKEGSVLLKNENNALPLAKGSKVNLYSASSVDLVYAGTGSSGTNNSKSVELKEALEQSGLTVNGDLWNWYKSNLSTYQRVNIPNATIGAYFNVKDASWANINTDAKNAKAEAAIFVLSRNGGEAADLTVSGGSSDLTDGNYLKLSVNEADVLKELYKLKKAGTINSIILLINSAYPIEGNFLIDDNDEYGVDSALWVGTMGSTGIYGVADLLVGEENPSGRLSDTYWKENYYNPALANFGVYSYSESLSGVTKGSNYVVYQEGIYVGYRYTETRYEDVVLGTANTGNYDYSKVVAYPFGYGLSYSDFTYSDFKVTPPLSGSKVRTYTVSVKVTNTGSVKGKEVVQIYLQKPYTQYDIDNHIEKSAVELVGFAKTDVLEPNTSETVTVEVKEEYFAAYDAYEARTYVVDAGSYYLTAAKDSHDAINNILAAKGKKITDGMTANGDAGLTYKTDLSFDDETYAVSSTTGEKITNQFDNADLNLYEAAGDNNHVDYVSRNNWEGTVKLGYDANSVKQNNQVKVTLTDAMKADVKTPTLAQDDIAYPTYDADHKYNLIDLRGLEYDAEEWDELLDQLSWDETVSLLTHGLRLTYEINSIVKPQTRDHNGALGPVEKYYEEGPDSLTKRVEDENIKNGGTEDKDLKNLYPTIYPCNGLLASTYNVKLIEQFGEAIGNDCLWAGYAGLYGPGLNIHRTPYGGRTFEYYSEDGVLTGVICAAETKGIQKYGCNVYLKHCFLNDQEKNREGLCTWANEQSIREIYLRAFQIAIEDGGAMNVMTGFNRIGLVWTGHQGFINTVLHGEFGMKGLAVTDWYDTNTGYMTMDAAVLNGNDIPDGTADASTFNNKKTGYGALALAMRESAHRILYHTVNSNAMNGISSDMIQVPLPIWWKDLLLGLEIATGILFGLSAVAFAGLTVWDKLDPKKAQAKTQTTDDNPEQE